MRSPTGLLRRRLDHALACVQLAIQPEFPLILNLMIFLDAAYRASLPLLGGCLLPPLLSSCTPAAYLLSLSPCTSDWKHQLCALLEASAPAARCPLQLP